MRKSMRSTLGGLSRATSALVAILLSILFVPTAGAQSCNTLPCSAEALPTPLLNSILVTNNNSNNGTSSPASNMISYRDEQHAWQTPDKLTHYLINIGDPSGSQGLQIWTRFVDPNTNVVTWVPGPFLPNSGTNSTADGRLVTNNGTPALAIVYSTQLVGSTNNGGNIAYMLLDYNQTPSSSQTGWTLDSTVSHSTSLQNVYTPASGYYALNPTFAIDTTTAGVYWVAYVLTQCQGTSCPPTSTIKLNYLAKLNGNSNWADTGLTFGPTDGNYSTVERSARLIATSNAIGMVYQVHQSFFWTYRLNSNAATAPWAAPLPLFTSAPLAGATSDPSTLYDSNPFASHYSAITEADNPAYVPSSNDQAAKVYMVTVDHQRLLYLNYGANQSGNWSNPQELGLPSETLSASYPQIFYAPQLSSTNQYMGALVNNGGNGVLYQSLDNGQTFNIAANLNHDNILPQTPVTFANPRFEVPVSVITNTIPVVQQYADQNFSVGSDYDDYLMFFNVSGLSN